MITKAKKTVAERVAEYGPAVRARLEPEFNRIGVAWPPVRMTLVGLKAEKQMEVWVGAAQGPLKRLKTYPIVAASGTAGPKLVRGDRQVPEGLYHIESLNPNSHYHLALRVDYPNAFDREHAARDGRTDLGGDIMIHGRSTSIGCLAMGDTAAEELFVLAAQMDIQTIAVILSPVDLTVHSLPSLPSPLPDWTGELYWQIRQALAFRTAEG